MRSGSFIGSFKWSGVALWAVYSQFRYLDFCWVYVQLPVSVNRNICAKMKQSENKPITMRDVAEHVGVSTMTVSRVLKNHPKIAAATRARVLAAVRELDYNPNPLLTALVQQRRRTRDHDRGTVLAYVIDEQYEIDSGGKSYWLYTGARDQARSLGFSLEVFPIGRKREDEHRLDKILYSRGIPGMILASMPLDIYTRSYDFQWERYAAVVLDYGFEGVALGQVLSDHYLAMRRVLTECSQRNIQKVGLVIGRVFHERVEHRVRAAYLDGCGEHSLPPLILDGWEDASFIDWFTAYRPEVVVSSLVYIHQITVCLKAAGIRVPEDVGLINLNTTPEVTPTALGRKVITGTDPMVNHMGAAAVNRLSAQLFRNERGIPAFASTTMIPPQWVEGETLRGL